ncbi:CHRD domain-containing protein [Nonomuraea typhae]|uniref:CHRD domain-containing protein n=1 Tax=Nonomuraea typhae TaxID=2603600 RepID=A0ABW7YKV1_9ACTN
MLTSAISGAILAASLSPVHAGSPDVYLAAGLRGADEVGSKGDGDGLATVVLKISGGEVTFAIRWNKVEAPSAARVHLGAKGANGDVKLDFFKRPLPKGVLAVTGTATADADLAEQLAAGPGGFYASLRNAAYPEGAVRGRFHKLAKPVDLDGVLHGSTAATLSSRAGGTQTVQAGDGKKHDDSDGDGRKRDDGAATWWLRPAGAALAYTATWTGVGAPTGGQVRKGAPGRNGEVVAGLFADARGLPRNLTGVAGEAPVARGVVRRIAADPGAYSSSLRTAGFDGGEVRGRLSAHAPGHPRALTADVLEGAQIYQCKGGAFVQLGVRAKLRGGIEHDFAAAFDGPPQWIAPDGSAVRGKLVAKTPNGDGNIPELLLDATQSGRRGGLLSFATTILRLNTTGGVAPTGSCKPGRRIEVPYGADYLYLG